MNVIAWLIVLFTLVVGYGWSARLLREHSLLAALLGLAISIGSLTLIVLWEGLLGIPFTLAGIALPYFALMLLGWWQLRKVGAAIRFALPSSWTERFMLLILLAISAAILFNGAYWPFSRADTLGIYQPAAQAMYQTQALVPLTGADSLYRAYPILVPLGYTYAYLVAGWENEYLAKAIATLLSLACLPATYVLGKMLRGTLAGWIAALVLALTPFFGAWASAGYVDLPMAFFYTLAAIFALRAWELCSFRDAVIAGALIGLAAWTKNAALIGIPLLAAWLIWCVLNKRLTWNALALSLAAVVVVTGAWYVRNLIGAGFLMPDTAWTDQAERSFKNLLVFVTRPENFGISGWLILLGIAVGIIDAARLKAGALLILLWALPFFAAWWLFASYDPRFLLLFLPLLCALSGDALARLWDRLEGLWKPRVRVAVALVVILLAAQVIFRAVEFKYDILRDPLMTDAEKHAIVRGD